MMYTVLFPLLLTTVSPDVGRLEVQSRKTDLQTFFGYFVTGVIFTLLTMNWLGLISQDRILLAFRTLARSTAITEQAATLSTKVAPKRCAEELKLVLVVRNDLRMGKGKIGAQCGHATLGAYQQAVKNQNPYLSQWLKEGQRKVVLREETEEALLNLRNQALKAHLDAYVVCDAGRTQIASGSITVVAIGPGPEPQLDKVTGHLKLL